MITVEVITHTHTHRARGRNPNRGGSKLKGLLLVEALLHLNFKGQVEHIQPEILGRLGSHNLRN